MKFNNQRANITIFVVIALIFIVIAIAGMIYSSKNKETSQDKEVKTIQSEYNKQDIDSEYEKALNKK